MTAGGVEGTLASLAAFFPPVAVYRGGKAPAEYLRGETQGSPNVEILLEESILLSLANLNPAYRDFTELFDEGPLREGTIYPGLLSFFNRFFREKPPAGAGGLTLIEMLRAPALASPDSLEGQLDYILRNWGDMVAPFVAQILTCLDFIREEDKPAFAGFGGAPPILDFWVEEAAAGAAGFREEKRYTPDRDWMSRVVMVAKSVWVWLHQLSVKYGRDISRLDRVPDEELDLLARWGFNAVWLIGVWERSTASRDIKRRSGNPEAEASAYSLYEYEIAADLGGRRALEELKARAWARGIRLAADMVPNHVGIYSRWVVEHPDWFIQADHPPFPSYRYSGPDLSPDPSVGLFIEDGYWSRSDAAVAFKRVDRRTGEVRYIYHGNDGTGLPWNDTAQLNYLLPQVREAAVNTILHVAGLFPIIRFDAAMTLARRHYQRLWFPAPGMGGDIPSRAGRGMSGGEFNRLFPGEFWREVVDRASVSAPDTLLLAEAFWLMEGYFVRTLGMHRVYNSAFMNMLKREANAEYRRTLKNVLEFDPEILKRFVNFMNNPDEETAVDQFGKGDKYFGTAVMLATLPGLPMVGHGQVEGFTEKYGMEYRRSYRDEVPDEELIRRHEREIFPLFRRRRLFAEAERFTLYDLRRGDGSIDENVFAYSNRDGDERCLVVYNNVYGSTAGIIREESEMKLSGRGRRTLGGELGLSASPRSYCVFTDAVHGLSYVRPSREIIESGLSVVLGGFQYHVFLDFREVADEDGTWSDLSSFLAGRGVEDLNAAMRELILAPLHLSFREFFNPRVLRALVGGHYGTGKEAGAEDAVALWVRGYGIFLGFCLAQAGISGDTAPLRRAVISDLSLALTFSPVHGGKAGGPVPSAALLPPGAALVPREASEDLPFWRLLLSYVALRRLGEIFGAAPDPLRSLTLLDEWLLGGEFRRMAGELGAGEEEIARESVLLRVLIRRQGWLEAFAANRGEEVTSLEELLGDEDVRKYLGFNRYRGVLWFVKERFEELAAWLQLVAMLDVLASGPSSREERHRLLSSLAGAAVALTRGAERSNYKVERLLAEIKT